ncbi:hypothetical protein CDAR_97531 [Caerostris darwini]|uniref:GPN-loop GTPase 2 n=1 Tax=Caerostris darwini TaxID=1538125 RepID=A0AAV4PTJ0_9ARAC|nr:hypothetical protein CDAR_97531 [Caerostris darwini]
MDVLLNKENRKLDNPEDYRPICILPNLGKVLDKIHIITERLSYLQEYNSLVIVNLDLEDTVSIILAIQSMTGFIYSVKLENKITCLTSIDLP